MGAPILTVDDDPMQRKMLSTLINRRLECDVLTAGHGKEALEILEKDQEHSIRLVILDVEMPVMGGLETLQIIKQQYPFVSVIMLTGSQDMNHAVQAIKLGATDFLSKPYEGERLVVTIKNALKIGMLSKEVQRLTSEKQGTFRFDNLMGYDHGLAPIIAIGRKAAFSDIPVLITGETGVGKEVFARAIHGESARSGKPFVAVNCGAIPSQLVESTLFGHEKGAFTGATEKTIGKFREADGGTIFLDEVGELPLETQVKLLRTLQQKEVEPVGAAKTVPINVRILSATNRNLSEETQSGRFREDLFFRLNVLNIEIPPLRQRRSDIPLLVRHFIDRFCVQHTKNPIDIAQPALELLAAREWRGNIRELENAVNRAIVLSEGNILKADDFQAAFNAERTKARTLPNDPFPKQEDLSLPLRHPDGRFITIDDLEQKAMCKVLQHFEGNITRAAAALGMAKSTFYRKMGGQD